MLGKMMKIDNFKYLHRTSDNIAETVFHASIDMTSGVWFWKKTETHRIVRTYANRYWKFLDTGRFTSEYFVEDLEIMFVRNQNYSSLNDVPIEVIRGKMNE